MEIRPDRPTMPVVLTFVGQFLPGFKAGGVLRTIVNMIDCLSTEFEFRVVTRDRDLGDAQRYPGISVETWTRVDKTSVWYMRPEDQTFASIVRIVRRTPHDVLYLNSVFDPTAAIRVLFARRMGLLPPKALIIAPRGEFSVGSLSIKTAKKRVYLLVARMLGIHDGVLWQASSVDEEADIRRIMGQVPIVVAPDLPSAVEGGAAPATQDHTLLRVVFVGRISREKNLDFALRILRQTQRPMLFAIYGPLEDAVYWDECQRLIGELPPRVSVSYRGPVPHGEVPDILAAHDLLLLPSTGENYGHVIVEAWSVGTPVLISDLTPWHDLQRDSLGWDFPLNRMDLFARSIDDYAGVAPETRMSQRTMIKRAAARRLNLDTAIQSNRLLLRRALTRSGTASVRTDW